MTRYRLDKQTKEWIPISELQKQAEREAFEIQSLGKHGDTRLVSHTLPLNWPYAPDHTPEGKCRFTSMKQIKEAVARANDHGEPVGYSRGMHNYGEGR